MVTQLLVKFSCFLVGCPRSRQRRESCLSSVSVDDEIAHGVNECLVLCDAVLEASLVARAAEGVAIGGAVVQEGVEGLLREVCSVVVKLDG